MSVSIRRLVGPIPKQRKASLDCHVNVSLIYRVAPSPYACERHLLSLCCGVVHLITNRQRSSARSGPGPRNAKLGTLYSVHTYWRLSLLCNRGLCDWVTRSFRIRMHSQVRQTRQMNSRLYPWIEPALVILIITMILPSLPSTQASGARVLWSCDFESGTQQGTGTYPTSCFDWANIADVPVVGNNPGEVLSTLTHSGKYAGYYYYTSPNAGSDGVTRDFWSIDWTGNQPTTLDFTVDGWFYVPSVTITSWVSFISIHFNGYSTISVDYNPAVYGSNRFLYLYNQMTPDWGFQASGKEVQFPFDRWFKLAVEVHYKLPNTQPSEFILYQDDVKIIDQVEAVRYNTPTNLLALHFGVYNDNGQKQFAIYNDDLSLTDLSGGTTTTTSTSTTSTTSTGTSTSTTRTTVGNGGYSANDGYTVLLLPMDGPDGSTSFPDSSPSNHAVTANGDAQIDTAQSKFGGASGLFDNGTSPTYLSLTDSNDWNVGSGNFTIDVWVRFNSLPEGGYQYLYSQLDSSGELDFGCFVSGGYLNWFGYVANGATVAYPHGVDTDGGTTLQTGKWYHVAFVRAGTGFTIYRDGVQKATATQTITVPDITAPALIGAHYQYSVYSNFFNGWMDEFRFSKGIARWTSNFTPPTDQSVQLAIWANDGVSHTHISGASVYVDGSLAGTTDSAGSLIIQVPAGVHELTVHEDGYGDAVTRINMISKVNFIVFLTRTT